MSKLEKVRSKARKLGVKGKIEKSQRKDKKFDLVINNKRVSFGSRGMEDYLDHGDDKRRASFRARMSGIKLKDGTRAINKRNSPAYLSYNLLW